MAITLTETAANRVRTFLENRGKGIGLRLGVKTSGCSGLAYVLEFVDVLNEDDQIFEQHGIKVIVDEKSLTYLDGTELDFVKEGLNEGFKYSNPNVKKELHPDNYASSSIAEQRLAIEKSADVNQALNVLKDPILRAEEIIKIETGVEKNLEEKSMRDVEFLMQQME